MSQYSQNKGSQPKRRRNKRSQSSSSSNSQSNQPTSNRLLNLVWIQPSLRTSRPR